MHLRSSLIAAAATLTVVFASAGPASAHEEISPASFATGRATFLTLTVANESSVDLVRVALRAPSGVGFGEATRSPQGWAAAVTDDTVTWTGGSVKPHTFESWGFEIGGVDQPGTLTYRITLGYAGGRSDEHELEVTATAPNSAGTVSSTTTSTTAPTGPNETTATSASAAGAPDRSESGSDGDSGMATAALVISLAALVLAVVALVAARRQGGGPAPNTASGGNAASGAAQDW